MVAFALIPHLLFWGIIGCLLFSAIVILFFLTGVIYAAVEKPDPKTKQKGYVGSFVIIIGIISIQIVSTLTSLGNLKINDEYLAIYIINYLLYILLFLYDTIIIDVLILVKWHPDFLHLPDEEVFTSTSYHLKTLIPGSIIGLALTGISTFLITLV